MTASFHRARYGVRIAQGADDLAACQALRHQCFFNRPGIDADGHDAGCIHVMIAGDAGMVATFRVMVLPSGAALSDSYAAGVYDLTALSGYSRPMLEIGRFCVARTALDADVLRLAWGALAGFVDAHDIGLMIGCSSFRGADPRVHAPALAVLGARHIGPPDLIPGVRAPVTVPLGGPVRDRRAGLAGLPSLLRGYLGLGGWVGDHAVVDTTLDTLHVFTAVPVEGIPPARARALRHLAQGSGISADI